MKKNTVLLISVFSIALVLFLSLMSCAPTGEGPAPTGEENFFGALVYNTLADLPTPSADNIGQLFYVIEEEKFYYSNGVEYVHIDLIISITWLGALDTAPANPQLNDVYYNTTEGIAYIWNGNAWEIMAMDGARVEYASGEVDSGDKLVLNHNLGSDDLIITAQFVKDGYIYDYSEYSDLFPDYHQKQELVFLDTGFDIHDISTTSLSDNGLVVASYYDDSSYAYVTAKKYIYNSTNREWQEDSGFNFGTYTDADWDAGMALPLVSTTALLDGYFVVAFTDYNYSMYAYNFVYFNIYDSDGSVVQYAYDVMTDDFSDTLSTTTLCDDTFVVAYNRTGVMNPAYGYFDIYYSYQGSYPFGYTTNYQVGDTYASDISVTPLKNRNHVIAYDNPSFSGYFDIYYSYETSINWGWTHFPFSDDYDASYISTATLPNGHFVIAYSDWDNDGRGMFAIYDNWGYSVVAPTVFNEQYTDDISVTALSNGNFVIAYVHDEGTQGHFKVYDSNGKYIEGSEGEYIDSSNRAISATALGQGSFATAYYDVVNDQGKVNVYTGAHLALKIVDNNTLELWNYTNENGLELRVFAAKPTGE